MTDRLVAPVLNVTRLSAYLKRLLVNDPELRDVAVRGEIANLRLPSASSKQLYFTLKDEQAVISCVVWPECVERMPPLREGSRVVVQAAVDVYPRGGRYQLNVRAAALDGDGALYVALEMLRKKLQAEGLFETEAKRPLPDCPFRIALVSSRTAQGAHDFLRVASRRCPHIEIVFIETAVQGQGAGEQVAGAIKAAARHAVDLIAIVRGGGASEDLWAFNDEVVVRAIRASLVPVLTGIGHESDVTLADHAADVRASTPTDAAMRLPALDDLYAQVRRVTAALVSRTRELIGRRRERIAGVGQRLERCSPLARLADRRRRYGMAQAALERMIGRLTERRSEYVFRLSERLARAMSIGPERKAARLALAIAKLQGRNPEAILELGYAIVRADSKAIHSTAEVAPGMLIEARLAHGTIFARVESLEHDGREGARSSTS